MKTSPALIIVSSISCLAIGFTLGTQQPAAMTPSSNTIATTSTSAICTEQTTGTSAPSTASLARTLDSAETLEFSDVSSIGERHLLSLGSGKLESLLAPIPFKASLFATGRGNLFYPKSVRSD